MVKHEQLSRAQLWCGDAVSFNEDGRCGCTECRLKFHQEMAAWAREQLMQEVEAPPCAVQNDQTKSAKSHDGKKQAAKSKGKETKGKDQSKDKGKDKGGTYPRGYMPWSDVLKKVSEKTFMDVNSVKIITDAVKQVAEEEIREGRAFHFRGLGSFKLVTGPRIEASAAKGRAFDAVSVLGLAKLEQ